MSINNKLISIDFGTTRTKMAYFDSASKKAELFRIGDDDKPYIPSLFYLSCNGEIFCGDDAVFLGKDDPGGLLDQPLKRSLRESIIIAGNGQKTTPKILLQTLFSCLREKLLQHPEFSSVKHLKAVITIPSLYGPPDEKLLREAAVNAGFEDENLAFIREPIAAAQAWFSETSYDSKYLIVLDCGGGTLDWACLKQTMPGHFELIPEINFGGDDKIGGYDIDEELYKHILSNLPHDEIDYFRKNKNTVIRQLQTLKEKFSKTKTDGVLSLSKLKVHVSIKDIEEVVKQRYVSQAIVSITPFISKVTSKLGNVKPDLLLVGGSSKFKLLYDGLSSSGACNPISWERSEFATVLGALNECCSSGVGLDFLDVDDVIHKGESAFSNSRYFEAYYYFLLVSCYRPSNGDVNNRMTEIESTIVNTPELLKKYRDNSISEGFDRDLAYLIYGWIYATTNQDFCDAQKAKTVFDALLKRIPECPLLYLGLTIISLAQENQNQTLSLLDKVIELDANQISAKYLKCLLYWNLGEVNDAACLLEQNLAADPDFVDAIVLQGKIASISFGEYDKAISLFNRAIELDKESVDNDEALFALGLCYKELNIDDTYKQAAFNCFNKSTKLGFLYSIRALADCYLEGFGTDEDATKAFCLYRVAAENGETYSMKFIGECYKDGYFVEQNASRAFKYYKQAADLEDAEAMQLVADCYENGIGVTKNILEARNWLRKAKQASGT